MATVNSGYALAHTSLRNCLKKVLQIPTNYGSTVLSSCTSLEYADLIYNGKWYSKACSAITAFMNETQENVTGSVKLKLYKGNIKPAGIFTENALYDESISSFGNSELYDHKDAEGFINLFTLPLKINAMKDMKSNK